MGGKGGFVIGCGAAQPSSSHTAQRSTARAEEQNHVCTAL